VTTIAPLPQPSAFVPLATDALVGRSEQLAVLRRFRRYLPARSAVVEGHPGVGKSCFARAVVSEAAREGWATLTIRGSAGFEGLPLGPLLNVLQLPGARGAADLAACVEERLMALRSPQGLLVVADECDELDEPSVALLQRLVTAGMIVAVLTRRLGVPLHPAFARLCRQGLAERITLANLYLSEATELLAALLGGRVQDSSAYRMWQVTEGNPAYLREVALSSVETGALREVDGTWRLRGEWARATRLQEIVGARLGPLDPDEQTAVEMLAFAGRLSLEVLTTIVPCHVVEQLEARAVVKSEPCEGRPEVTIAHPLHAEVLRSAIPPLRRRALRQRLVDALGRSGTRRSSDEVRLACWSLEPGRDADSRSLDRGTRASMFPTGSAVASRLCDLVPGVPLNSNDHAEPVIRRDLDLAVVLARTAYERRRGVAEGAALADVLVMTGRAADAEAVLGELPGLASDDDDRLRLAIARAKTTFWGRFEADAAIPPLLAAVGSCRTGTDPSLLAAAYETLGEIELNAGRPVVALAHAERSVALLGLDPSETSGPRVRSSALAFLGRCSEALALVERAVPQALARGDGVLVAHLLFDRARILAWTGRHEQARQLAESVREVALSSGDPFGTAVFGLLAGWVMLREGRPASAGRLLADSAELLADHDAQGVRAWALYALAIARAQSGDEGGAAAALAEGRHAQGSPRFFESTRHLAEVALHQRARRSAAAASAAREGAEAARTAGMVHDEALLLDAWVRVEPSQEAVTRLSALTAATDSELVAALARHARALLAEDPDGLLAAAKELAGMDAYAIAAEAAVAATRIFRRRHLARLAESATRLAESLASRCEAAPAAITFALPAGLTRRELDVVELAAARLSSKEIASRLYLSVRTVENYIYHACLKMGVSDRAGLARALSASIGKEPPRRQVSSHVVPA
jgi:DNA-binding NarL/FixJ family response regulator